MKIGVPREVRDHEHRVAITPAPPHREVANAHGTALLPVAEVLS